MFRVYRWSRIYMDQIHEIQTRGASAVEAFAIGSYTYIAIAQAQDAAGNYEVCNPLEIYILRFAIDYVFLQSVFHSNLYGIIGWNAYTSHVW